MGLALYPKDLILETCYSNLEGSKATHGWQEETSIKFYVLLRNKGVYRDRKAIWKFFQNVLNDCNVVDIGYSRVPFTWEKGNLPKTNIREHLDRGVANDDWLQMFPEYHPRHLPHSTSDHCSILIQYEPIICRRDKTRFRFEIWWTMEQSFETGLRRLSKSSNGHIIEKLEQLAKRLKHWATGIQKQRFGLKKKLEVDLEWLLGLERNDKNMADLTDTKVQLNWEIDKEEVFWEQRARTNWLRLGDKNITFFHRHAAAKKKMNQIHRLEREDGTFVEIESNIEDLARTFFHDLFSTEGVGDMEHLVSGIEASISPEDNRSLVKEFFDEIFNALRDMGPNKVSGFDGFPALFFRDNGIQQERMSFISAKVF